MWFEGLSFSLPLHWWNPCWGVPGGIHLVLITLSYLICSLFKQEWMLRFASGVCLSVGPFHLVFVFKVKAWLMRLIFTILFFFSFLGPAMSKLATKSLSFICWKRETHKGRQTSEPQHLYIDLCKTYLKEMTSESAFLWDLKSSNCNCNKVNMSMHSALSHGNTTVCHCAIIILL